ncbi:type II toxin-antitoxin system RelE/ParE family toxin [Bacteroides sp. 519]|uniref:type II toxin-antitoxin system RelE/ParE family toxin n=1 Tax=Bacteroides sp. 519 TaxID=2302937 RepID=UPI0013D0C2E8|nr:type II toxin-antitoxin system RelE/ParE family toxin [Bacteroides sp. 519]NDV59748.1 type II toxin-antitoxin system RelE/ParE family toxin [Bacteroides sp. 519]
MIYRLSPQAENDLMAIEIYYTGVGNKQAGNRIVDSIISCIHTLIHHPYLGHPEPMLQEFPQSFRTMVNVPNYKIVYWVEEDIVKIATIFDCRQFPMKLHNLINKGNMWICEPQVEYKKSRQ